MIYESLEIEFSEDFYYIIHIKIKDNMDIAFYKTPCSFEVLPMFTINIVEHNGRKAYCIMLGWLQWILDFQWETK